MPQVIDLLSSSPPQLPFKITPVTKQSTRTSRDIFTLDSDDLDTLKDLEFPSVQPSKRRKLSPLPDHTDGAASGSIVGDDVFNLSSDRTQSPGINDHEVPIFSKQLDKIRTERETEEPDAFHFSSSAPERTMTAPKAHTFVLELSSDNEAKVDDHIQSSSQPEVLSRPALSQRTANLLASLRDTNAHSLHSNPKPKKKRSMSADLALPSMRKFKGVTKPTSLNKDDIIDSSQVEKNKSGTKMKSAAESCVEEVISKVTAKSLAKATKDAEKEAERTRKQKVREEKAQEKQKAAEMAEVNKSRTNKKISSSEMIVDMPDSLKQNSIGKEVEQYLTEVGARVIFSHEALEEVGLISDTGFSFGHIVRWQRRVVADYDEDLEVWKPLPQPRVTREKHVLLYLKAEDFVNIAAVDQTTSGQSTADSCVDAMKINLDIHIRSIRTRYPDSRIICLIEGLTAWHRKSQTVKNRAYTAAVRSQMLEQVNNDNETEIDLSINDANNTALTSQTQSRITTKRPRKQRAKATSAIDFSKITTDTTESLLLHLQLHHQPLVIHHTPHASSTAQQISTFTQHLSTRPYRLAEQNHNLSSASFCMATGQIRTGSTTHETYINMLQEINRVTPSMAYGISAAGYKSVRELVEGFRSGGNLMLEDVRKSVNKDGGWSDRRLGPMVSKRLWKVFMGRDPGSRDGMA